MLPRGFNAQVLARPIVSPKSGAGAAPVNETAAPQTYTGAGAPDASLGSNGDTYVDITPTVAALYKRIDGTWVKQVSL